MLQHGMRLDTEVMIATVADTIYMIGSCKIANRLSYNAKNGCPSCTIVAPTRNQFEMMRGTNITFHANPTDTGEPRRDSDAIQDSLGALSDVPRPNYFWRFVPFLILRKKDV